VTAAAVGALGFVVPAVAAVAVVLRVPVPVG
jgi:hypothetical protein